jgi:serine/threonine protein kinase
VANALVHFLVRLPFVARHGGWDDKFQRKVAIKTILTSQLSDPALMAEYAGRFVQEARAAAQLIHPNIVTVFDFGNRARHASARAAGDH